jgi:predicted ArsR family transcriptional regulator
MKTAAEKIAAAYIATRGTCSARELADATGWEDRKAQRVLAGLESEGHLVSHLQPTGHGPARKIYARPAQVAAA